MIDIAILGFSIYLTISTKDFNLTKMIITDLIFLILSVIVFLLFFGLYEFLNSFTVLEDEISQLQKDLHEKDLEIQVLEEKINPQSTKRAYSTESLANQPRVNQPFSKLSPNILNGEANEQRTGN